MKPRILNAARLSFNLAAALAALLAAPAVCAASDSWNVDADGNWATAGSWVTAAPGSTSVDNLDIATFSKLLTAGRAVTVDTNRYIGGISFGNTSAYGYTLGTGILHLNNAGVIQTISTNGNHTDTISSAIVLDGGNSSTATITAGATSASSLLSIGAITGTATTTTTTLTLNGANTGANAITGVIGDGGGGGKLALIKSGTGSWVLSGNNTYTGGTTLSAGRLNINASGTSSSNSALGTGTLVLSAGIIDNTSNSDVTLATNNNITYTSSSATSGNTFGGSGNLSFGTGTLTDSAHYSSLYLMGTSSQTLSVGTWTNSYAGDLVKTFQTMPGSNSSLNIGTMIMNGQAGKRTELNGNSNITIGILSQNGLSGGNVRFNNSGTITLTGASTYDSGAYYNGGTVILDATSSAASLVANGTANFGGGTFIFKGDAIGTGSNLGNVALSAGASTMKVVGGTSGTTLTLGTLTDAGNNTMLNIVLSGNSPVVTSTTAVSTNGIFGTRAAITVTTGGTTEYADKSGTSIVQYTGQTVFTGTTSGTATNYSVAGNQTLTTAASTPNTIKITTSADNQSLDLGSNTMKITSGGILFTGSNTGYEIKGSAVKALMSGTGAATPDLIIHNFGTGGLKISAIIGNGGTGAQVLSVDGPGTTTLSGVNTYTGATLVGGGAVLSIGANSGLGADGATVLTLNNGTLQATGTFGLSGTNTRTVTLGANGGTFDVTSSYALTVGGVISNTGTVNNTGGIPGSLTKIGTGTLLLTGNNTYFGGFTYVKNGTLQIGGASGAIASMNIVALGDSVANTGGTLVLGDSSNTKSQTIAGLVNLGSGASAVVGGNASNSTLTYTGSAAQPTTFSGMIGGASTNQNHLALTVTAGLLTLSGTNTYTGLTTVSGGSLQLGGGGSIASGNALTTSGTGTFDINGNSQTLGVVTNGSSIINSGTGTPTLTIGNGSTGAGVYAGNMNLVFNSGGGTATLSGSNSYTGLTDVQNGTLSLAHSGGTILDTAAVQVSGGTLDVAQSDTVGAVTLSSGTISGAGTLTGSSYSLTNTGTISASLGSNAATLTKTGAGTATLSGSNAYTGLTDVQNGTLSLAHSGGTILDTAAVQVSGGTLDVAQSDTVGAVTLSSGTISGAGTLTGSSYSLTNTGTISASLGSNAATLTKTGAGTATLSGNNSYSGGTTVSNGVLLVNNTSGSGTGSNTVNVTGGKLGGTGTISGAVTIGAAGTLAPTAQASTNKLTLGSTVGFDSGGTSIFEWDLNATNGTDPVTKTNQGTYGQVAATGAASGTAVFTIVLGSNVYSNAFWNTNKSWDNVFSAWGMTDLTTLFTTFGGASLTATGTGATAKATTPSGGYFSFSGTTLNYTAVPEPSSVLAGLLLGAGLLRRRRK